MCGYFCIGFIDFVKAGKKLTDFKNMFSPYEKKNYNIILSYTTISVSRHEQVCLRGLRFERYFFHHRANVISKMNEINKINLSEQTESQLSQIIGIKDYFHLEINQRKSCSKKLSKYVTAFDYIDKILIVLSATSSASFRLQVLLEHQL